MSKNKNIEFESKCVHSGIGDYEFGPVVPPIYQTSTFSGPITTISKKIKNPFTSLKSNN